MTFNDPSKWARYLASRPGSVAALSVGLFWNPKGRKRGPIRPRPQKANVSRLDASSQDRTAPHTGAVPEPTGSRFSERHPGGADLRSAGAATRKRPVGSDGGSTQNFPRRRIFRVEGFSESAASRDPGAWRFGRPWPPRAVAAAHSGAARHGGRGLPGCGGRPRPRAFSGPNRQSELTCSPTVNVRNRGAMTE